MDFQRKIMNDLNIIDKNIVKKLAVRATDFPPTLYHYTNKNGFTGILKTRHFWATDYQNLKNEIVYGQEIISKRLNVFESDDGLSGFSGCVYFVKNILPYYQRRIFISSFSENMDDLEMWKNYTEKGIGFAIGIDPLKVITKYSTLAISEDASLRWIKMIYGHENQMNLVDSAIREYYENFRAIKSLCQTEEQVKFLQETTRNVMAISLYLFPFVFKEEKCSYEKEWRAVRIRTVGSADEKTDVKYKESEFNKKPSEYVELNFSSTDNSNILPITEIKMGPQCCMTISAVQRFLGETGYGEFLDKNCHFISCSTCHMNE